MSWIRAAAPRVRRLTTVCSGTFLGAEAGLLDGRTRHHALGPGRPAGREFPTITVDADPIYRRDGDVWTSAGVTAGIDLALALVEDDHGADVAQNVARWLVMFLHRPGGQSQFATPVWSRRADRPAVRAVQSAIEAAPGGDHRVPVLADAAAMSARHFTRLFTDEVGETPARYVERVRLEAARQALETTDATLDVDRRPLRLRHRRDPAPGLPPPPRRRPRRLPPPLHARQGTDAHRPESADPMKQIAIPLFPRFTALDAIGPYEVLQRLPGYRGRVRRRRARRGAHRQRDARRHGRRARSTRSPTPTSSSSPAASAPGP